MPVTVVVGTQWGDEAKGKLADLLSEEADVVARFNGGDNAGHTVVNAYGTFKLRLTPNGVANPKTQCVLGPGVVINLSTLLAERTLIRESGIDLTGRLWVSPRCHVVMPYHPLLEEIYENAKGEAKTGTTRRGMGPVYGDKVSYNGIRLFDLFDETVFAEKLRTQLRVKNALFEAFGLPALRFDDVYTETLEKFEQARDVVREPFGMLQDALQRGANIVLEGAQAALLDTDWGTYPFSTASTTLVGGATAGLGIAPRWISRVIGVTKAYTTRVGRGPMPTELNDETGEVLLREGQEFGTVTGRSRRCGWLDAELVRFTAQLNGLSEVFLTKLDVLDTLPKIKICVAYRHREGPQGQPRRYWEGDARWLDSVEPEYIEVDGWQASTKGIRHYQDLPRQAQAYVRKVEELIGVPISMVSTGPGREEVIPVPAGS